MQRWDVGHYFEAHELLEHVWHHAPDAERLFWQGVIQVAVAHVMGQRGRPPGAIRTAQKARPKLADVPVDFHGIDVAALLLQLDRAEEQARRGEPADQPPFPALAGGPWFDQTVSRTPLTREPPWMVASQDLARRTAEQDDR